MELCAHETCSTAHLTRDLTHHNGFIDRTTIVWFNMTASIGNRVW